MEEGFFQNVLKREGDFIFTLILCNCLIEDEVLVQLLSNVVPIFCKTSILKRSSESHHPLCSYHCSYCNISVQALSKFPGGLQTRAASMENSWDTRSAGDGELILSMSIMKNLEEMQEMKIRLRKSQQFSFGILLRHSESKKFKVE